MHLAVGRKMCKAVVYVVLSCLISGIAAKSAEYRRECDIWKQEISRIKKTEHKLDVTCKVNAQCTGFDCNGTYTYNGLYTGYRNYIKSLCFGLWISPCTTPQNFTVYIEQTSDNISFIYSTASDGTKEVDIPGAEETIDLVIKKVKAKITVETYVDHSQIKNNPFMEIGLKIKPKIIYTKENIDYPEDLQVALVKKVKVPVPACDPTIPKTTHKAHKCPDLTKDNKVNPTGFMPTVTPCVQNQLQLCDDSRCYCVNSEKAKICKPVENNVAVFGNCYHNQGCNYHQVGKSTPSYCGCRLEYHMDEQSGNCVPDKLTTKAPDVINYPDSAGQHSKLSSKQNVIIIASCSGVAIILAIVATSFVVWRYIKHRARYSNHSLLRNQDDDFENDVPPIDLET